MLWFCLIDRYIVRYFMYIFFFFREFVNFLDRFEYICNEFVYMELCILNMGDKYILID